MKRFRLILGGLLGLFLVAAPVASLNVMAQDDAYMTPSQAKVQRAKAVEERKQRLQRLEEKRKKEEAIRKAAEEQYANKVNDWYNRRDMKVTIEEMEDNLDALDGKSLQADRSRAKGGKYSKRLRRFGKDRDDVIVLNNVERVYVVDDYDYDPWSGTYYGRDWGNNINIIISDRGSYGWGYPYYSPWYASYYYSPWTSWSYPWYDSWYSPWYDPWYSPRYYGWGYRPYYRGWGFNSPWGGFYSYSGYYPGSYYDSYWNGYYDGRYDGRYDGGYYRHYDKRNYNTYGRSSGGYYDRSMANSEYGRALGSGINSRNAETRAGGYYNRGSNSSGSYNHRSGSTSRSDSTSRSWDRNSSQSSSWGNSGSWGSGSSTSTRSSGSSSGSSSRSSGSSNSRSSGSSGRTR